MSSEPAAERSAIYEDRVNRKWLLTFTIGNAANIKKDIGLDFVNAHNGQAITAISTDDSLLVSVAWELCREQAGRINVSQQSWAEGIDGATLGRIIEALGVAIVNFSPPAKRPVMQAMLDRADQVANQTAFLMAAKVRSNRLNQLMTQIVERQEMTLEEAIARRTTGS